MIDERSSDYPNLTELRLNEWSRGFIKIGRAF